MVISLLRHRFLTKFRELNLVVLISSLSTAFISTIWAIYVYGFVQNESLVGTLSAIFTLVSIFAYFYLIPFFEKKDPTKIYSIALILNAILYVLFAINKSFYFFILISLIFVIVGVLGSTSFGIIIRKESGLKNLSKREGLVYTLSNTGFLVGPLIAGFVSDLYGISSVFLLAAIFIFMAFVAFKAMNIHEKVKIKKIDKNIFQNFKDFIKEKELLKSYSIGGGISLYWSIIYIYVPLYIIQQGLSKSVVGMFLFAVCIPLILLEYPIGKNVDRIGFKKFFFIGYGILAIGSFFVFFMPNIYYILILLVLTSIGAAFLEPTKEAYFFKIVPKGKEKKYYGPFLTSNNVFSIIGKLVAAGILLILPFKFIFLALGGGMLIFGYLGSKAKK